MKIARARPGRFARVCGLWVGLLACALATAAQTTTPTTTVTGVVRDAKTQQPLPYVSVAVPQAAVGTTTDENGRFALAIPAPYTTLVFSYLGYQSATRTVPAGPAQELSVRLAVSATSLGEVVVKAPKAPRYQNKDNPAVALIRQVIAHKEQNRPESYQYVEYEQYEKMAFSLSNLSDKFKRRKAFASYQFLFKEQDSAAIGGKNLLPIYLEEKLSRQYYRQSPAQRKAVVLGTKQVQFDKNFIDNDGLQSYFTRMYQDVDVYANNVTIIGNQFLSPIASSAPTFYQYFITDTLRGAGPALVELSFTPRNKGDLLFEGKLYVTLDGHYAVQQAELGVNRRINLNFVRSLAARVEFAPNPDGRYHQRKSVLQVEFGVLKNKGSGFYGQRTVSVRDYRLNQPPPAAVFDDDAALAAAGGAADSTARLSAAFWQASRHDSLSATERAVYHDIDTLQTIPSFRRTLELFTFLFSGYKSFGAFEVGPANTFYSFNPVEGFRVRVGGRTTPELSKRIFFETYAAYGFKDEKWKYFLSSTYSLNNKSIYTFPQNFLRASFQRDTRIPGQELEFVQEDNFLLSFKRGVNDRWLYNDIFRLDYLHEFSSHFSYALGVKRWRQAPAGGLYFRTGQAGEPNGEPNTIAALRTTEVGLTLRWAPKESFYQGKLYRVPIIGPYPVFTARFTAGLKGPLAGEYNYQNLGLSVVKRVYLSQLGFADVNLEGGYVLGRVPFPLLTIHRANQTYSYQLNSYNLMNFLEFSSDHYASVFIDQNFNGFFFNKLPLVRRLKLREVASLKVLYGGIRAENDPARHPDLYQFVENGAGQPTSFALGRAPYVEASLGVANIFKIFRLDVVKRLNCLDQPNVAEWGLRGRFKVTF
ncbi:DUF5686 family protein [uncultured Hymenobacter sp.]|uniref:DUF5686 and carboxypeptidase-like regulatory domain-containing protein n=1 Tax=uncultured Hymenobacter sp. TaxID=170016 RepID=UPI0035C9CAC7